MNHIEIVILDANQKTLDELATNCEQVGNVKLQKVERVLYTRPPRGMDALFLVLPAAEKWGAKPLVGKAQVLKTSAEDQRAGMPRYVVTGVVLRSTDPRGPIPETRMLVRTALDATQEFNRAHLGNEIRSLGFWAVNLLNGVTPKQLSIILNELLREKTETGANGNSVARNLINRG